MTTIEKEGSVFQEYEGFTVEYRDASHRYWGEVLPEHDGATGFRQPWASVTTILSILDKPALRRWYGKEDTAAALILERSGEAVEWIHPSGEVRIEHMFDYAPDRATELLRLGGLGAEAKRDAGASRGTALHDALEGYCKTGVLPRVSSVEPPEARGYVQGLAAWLIEADPEPLLVERIVGSPLMGVAGRFDLLATIEGISTLVDLKTGTNAHKYPESHLQLRGYELCFPECLIPSPQRSMILALNEDGSYETAECRAKPEDFLAVLSAHRAVGELKKALKEGS